MAFINRYYQTEAITRAIDFLTDPKTKGGALEILPTGSGKSIVIAGIVQGLPGNTIVLQPSKEILEQNYAKLVSYGYRAGIYSASFGKRQIHKITFATIGSIINRKDLFREFQHIIIDECHLVNAKGGMYSEFINHLDGCKVLGVTATPYRLSSGMGGAMLKFLTRTRPKIFSKVIYAVQNKVLFDAGYLAKLRYFNIKAIERKNLQKNSTGADFTDNSLRLEMQQSGFNDKVANMIHRLLAKNRRGILVFTSLIEESEALCKRVPGAVIITGKTDAKQRKFILAEFKAGKVKVVCNVGVLTTGFDYPELDTIIIARPTMSLALYYQMVGRAIRIHDSKDEAWIVDMCDNIGQFGRVEDLKLKYNNGLWTVNSCGRQLTNTVFN